MVTTGERKPWHAIFRLLERDERVFAVLLAVAMVAGLATLGLVPLRPRQQIDLNSLVLWFALYKIGIFALVTVYPTRTRAIFLGALGIDLLLVFVLMFLTGRPGHALLPPVLPARGGQRLLLRSVAGAGHRARGRWRSTRRPPRSPRRSRAGPRSRSWLRCSGFPRSPWASWPSVSGARAARSSGSTPR